MMGSFGAFKTLKIWLQYTRFILSFQLTKPKGILFQSFFLRNK